MGVLRPSGGFVFVVCFHGLCDVFDVASPVTTGLYAFGAVEGWGGVKSRGGGGRALEVGEGKGCGMVGEGGRGRFSDVWVRVVWLKLGSMGKFRREDGRVAMLDHLIWRMIVLLESVFVEDEGGRCGVGVITFGGG